MYPDVFTFPSNLSTFKSFSFVELSLIKQSRLELTLFSENKGCFLKLIQEEEAVCFCHKKPAIFSLFFQHFLLIQQKVWYVLRHDHKSYSNYKRTVKIWKIRIHPSCWKCIRFLYFFYVAFSAVANEHYI